MTNSVSSNRPEKYNIAAFFSGVGGIELGFEQTNEFRVVYANEFDKYARQTYRLIIQIRIWIVVIFMRCSRKKFRLSAWM